MKYKHECVKYYLNTHVADLFDEKTKYSKPPRNWDERMDLAKKDLTTSG